MIDRMVIQIEYLADIFTKWMKCVYHFEENNWLYLLPMIKFEFSVKIKILENLYLLSKLDSFPILIFFHDEIGGGINKYDFLMFIVKCADIWKTCINN